MPQILTLRAHAEERLRGQVKSATSCACVATASATDRRNDAHRWQLARYSETHHWGRGGWAAFSPRVESSASRGLRYARPFCIELEMQGRCRTGPPPPILLIEVHDMI